MVTAFSTTHQQPGSERSHWRACLVSAPPGVPLAVLREVLEERGIKLSLLSSTLRGASIVDRVADGMAQSDLVVAVLKAVDANASVYYDIGYAQALYKRLLVIAPPGLALAPEVASAPYVIAEATNREIIGFALDQVLAAPNSHRSKPTKSIPSDQPDGLQAYRLTQELASYGDRITAANVRSLVAQALHDSEMSVVVRSQEMDTGADLVAWVDELDAWGENPLPVNIRLDLNDHQVEQTKEEMQDYINSTNSHLGLILYIKGPQTLPTDSFPVLFLSLRALVDELATKSFGDIISRLRNRAAYGIDL